MLTVIVMRSYVRSYVQFGRYSGRMSQHCGDEQRQREHWWPYIYSSLFVKKNDSIEKIKKNVTKLQTRAVP